MKALLRAWTISASGSRSCNHNGKSGSVGSGGKPLVAVDDPFVAIFDCRSLDLGRIRTGGVGFCHGETRSGSALAERAQPRLLLLFRSKVQKRMHVSFVWGLAVDDVRTHFMLHRFRGHGGHSGYSEPHATPFFGHMWSPQALVLCNGPHAFDRPPIVAGSFSSSFCQCRLGGFREEPLDEQSRIFDVWRKGEINGHIRTR